MVGDMKKGDFLKVLQANCNKIDEREIKEIIRYYDELLSEQGIGEDDVVDQNKYDVKKIINDYRFISEYDSYMSDNNQKKVDLRLLGLAILSMPTIIVILMIAIPIVIIILGGVIFLISSFVWGSIYNFSEIILGVSENFFTILTGVGIILLASGIVLLTISIFIKFFSWIIRKISRMVYNKKNLELRRVK